jgi:hypothetical protein
VVALVEHGILAARRNDDIFDAIAIEVANRGLDVGQHGELVAKLFMHEVVVDCSGVDFTVDFSGVGFRGIDLSDGRRLSEGWKQKRDKERGEYK